MFKLVSRGVRLACNLRSISVNSVNSSVSKVRPFTRSYWLMTTSNTQGTKLVPEKCSCGCSSRASHSKGDKELAEFIAEEITAEQKTQSSQKLPKIEGFDVTTNGATVTFDRSFDGQKVRVTFNVNHTVDAEIPEQDVNPSQDKVDLSEMKSKPSFVVEIENNGKTLSFGCSIVQDVNPNDQGDPDAYNDVFNIDEVSIHEGKAEDSTYSVSGEIMDGYLYDLFMNFLEERGISNDFAEKLVSFATAYEHRLYVGLLENIKSFVSK